MSKKKRTIKPASGGLKFARVDRASKRAAEARVAVYGSDEKRSYNELVKPFGFTRSEKAQRDAGVWASAYTKD